MLNDIGIELVSCWIIVPGELCHEVADIPRQCMYQVMDILSQDGKYEVFATEDGGKVVGQLNAIKED